MKIEEIRAFAEKFKTEAIEPFFTADQAAIVGSLRVLLLETLDHVESVSKRLGMLGKKTFKIDQDVNSVMGMLQQEQAPEAVGASQVAAPAGQPVDPNMVAAFDAAMDGPGTGNAPSQGQPTYTAPAPGQPVDPNLVAAFDAVMDGKPVPPPVAPRVRRSSPTGTASASANGKAKPVAVPTEPEKPAATE